MPQFSGWHAGVVCYIACIDSQGILVVLHCIDSNGIILQLTRERAPPLLPQVAAAPTKSSPATAALIKPRTVCSQPTHTHTHILQNSPCSFVGPTHICYFAALFYSTMDNFAPYVMCSVQCAVRTKTTADDTCAPFRLKHSLTATPSEQLLVRYSRSQHCHHWVHIHQLTSIHHNIIKMPISIIKKSKVLSQWSPKGDKYFYLRSIIIITRGEICCLIRSSSSW